MTYDQFNKFCGAMPTTTYVMQWGGSHVWKVGGKVFAIGGWQDDDKPAYTFKVSDEEYEILRNVDGFRPAPYMAARGMKWIQMYEDQNDDDQEIKYYLQESHRIVSLGLTKKLQKELRLNQDK